MPRQNRVTPLSELIADPSRGLVYGNRGCLHDERGRIRRRYNGKRWIACRLEFRGLASRPASSSRASSRSCSSSMRRRRLLPAIGRAPSAAARTTTVSTRSGASSILARSARTRSTPSSTENASTERREISATIVRGPTSFRTEPSCWRKAHRGSSTGPSSSAGPRPATPSAGGDRPAERCRWSRHPRSSRFCRPDGNRSCLFYIRLRTRRSSRSAPARPRALRPRSGSQPDRGSTRASRRRRRRSAATP